jgi:hypothetical protein
MIENGLDLELSEQLVKLAEEGPPRRLGEIGRLARLSFVGPLIYSRMYVRYSSARGGGSAC